jgi:C-terminal processing protease CtpA/Prc
MKRLAGVIVLALCALQFLSAQAKRESSPQVRQKTFDVVWKTINEKYFDPKLGGVDWTGVRSPYAPQVAAVTSDRELFDLLDRMLRELPVSHLRFIDFSTLEQFMARSVVMTGIALRNLDGQVVATRVVDGSPAHRAGVQPGFAVRAVDTVMATDARSTEVLLATGGQHHVLTLIDGANTTHDIRVARELPPADMLESTQLITATRHALMESKRVAGGIGYVHFTNFIASLKKKRLAAVASMKDAPGLIIDLRGNSGGDNLGMDPDR